SLGHRSRSVSPRPRVRGTQSPGRAARRTHVVLTSTFFLTSSRAEDSAHWCAPARLRSRCCRIRLRFPSAKTPNFPSWNYRHTAASARVAARLHALDHEHPQPKAPAEGGATTVKHGSTL